MARVTPRLGDAVYCSATKRIRKWGMVVIYWLFRCFSE